MQTRPGSANPSPPRVRLWTLGGMLAAWRDRNRFHTDLERKLQGDPHLIDDVGLTRRQVEEELAKPFWQVL
ncbi:hypothetical protein BC374_13105 [Ensifer sp. LC13]|nr:hypothetical protein BC362_28490 [Ensifer sp. LC14]OCP13299.1 hypothetical protein BC374_13105 [Ensifer sp. LC13]OCP13900.1 hypothetical protein BBX50_13385 [Ensifer sp. LC11]OCP28281.1 hypothetical protein BC364_11505 [Ensifer sp. LC499]